MKSASLARLFCVLAVVLVMLSGTALQAADEVEIFGVPKTEIDRVIAKAIADGEDPVAAVKRSVSTFAGAAVSYLESTTDQSMESMAAEIISTFCTLPFEGISISVSEVCSAAAEGIISGALPEDMAAITSGMESAAIAVESEISVAPSVAALLKKTTKPAPIQEYETKSDTVVPIDEVLEQIAIDDGKPASPI